MGETSDGRPARRRSKQWWLLSGRHGTSDGPTGVGDYFRCGLCPFDFSDSAPQLRHLGEEEPHQTSEQETTTAIQQQSSQEHTNGNKNGSHADWSRISSHPSEQAAQTRDRGCLSSGGDGPSAAGTVGGVG